MPKRKIAEIAEIAETAETAETYITKFLHSFSAVNYKILI